MRRISTLLSVAVALCSIVAVSAYYGDAGYQYSQQQMPAPYFPQQFAQDQYNPAPQYPAFQQTFEDPAPAADAAAEPAAEPAAEGEAAPAEGGEAVVTDGGEAPAEPCAADGECVEAETPAEGFSLGDDSDEATFAKRLEDLKNGVTKRTKSVTEEQAWVEQVETIVKKYNKKLNKVKDHVDQERLEIRALLNNADT
jgi:hypothetical protein